MKRLWLGIIFALFCGLVSQKNSLAQDKPLKKLNWGVTSLSAAMWIPWLAKEAKIYEKNGLDVETILLRGSGQTSQALLGGSLFAAPVALPTLMLANLSGADFVNVAHTVAAVNSKLLVKPEIRKPEDLKGKKLATSSLGSLGDFLFRYILRKYGVDPNREITWLSIGTTSERLQALVLGQIDAADVTYPTDVQGERMGFRVLIDARKEVVYPSTSIVTRRKTIQEDRDSVMRLVRSHVEGIAYFKTRKEFSLKVLTKYVKTTDPEYLEGSYAIFKQDFISAPYPITRGLEAIYDYVAQTRPDIRSHRPEEFVDPSFIAELDRSGFIKKLYEQR
ncbi:MAG TPA: ABC transporter substrate-binding protein [Candidatus Binatia bacterium]|jgi:NitT/TauT family transport system substrate-binding protein|nr:ABC transporter substrate-binding protein [Candidatus Binatia bacterium]